MLTFHELLGPNAVKQLHDRLVDMGFENSEADSFIEKVPDLGFPGGANVSLFTSGPMPTTIELTEDLSGLPLSLEEKSERGN